MILPRSAIHTILNFAANVSVIDSEKTNLVNFKENFSQTPIALSSDYNKEQSTSYIILVGDGHLKEATEIENSVNNSEPRTASQMVVSEDKGFDSLSSTSNDTVLRYKFENSVNYQTFKHVRTTAKPTTRRKHGRKNNHVTTTSKTPAANETNEGPWLNDMTWDDATWILTASFIIFTMQTGLTYWLFGFSISFGTDAGASPYFGVGEYMVDSRQNLMGPVFAAFMFQLSFATTATTIVSGTMAERCNFKAYCIFSMTNTIVYCVPARWIWGPTGFLGELGVIDIAGSGAVHLLGGGSGFVAAWMLGPRLGRYENGTASLPLGNPSSCIVGLYILWWGWLAFNSGSTFGVSGQKWKFAARAAVTTVIASIGGGIVGCIWAFAKPQKKERKIFEVMDIVNPLLGALVGVTAGCALYRTIDAFIVGAVGGLVVILTAGIPDKLRVDDPVGATAVHGFAGLWGLIAVALFAEDDRGLGFTKGRSGVLRGGTFYLLTVQLLAAACITVWSVCITFCLLLLINVFVPIRMEAHEELLGADLVEHLVYRRHAGLSPALSALGSHPEVNRVHKQAAVVGSCNPMHETITDTIKGLGSSLWSRLRTKTLVASAFMKVLNDLKEQRVVAAVDRTSVRQYSVESANIVDQYLGSPFRISAIVVPIETNSAVIRNKK